MFASKGNDKYVKASEIGKTLVASSHFYSQQISGYVCLVINQKVPSPKVFVQGVGIFQPVLYKWLDGCLWSHQIFPRHIREHVPVVIQFGEPEWKKLIT